MAAFKRTAIIGVGLIGGSLGLALRSRRLSVEVIGVGHRESTLRRAKRRGAIDGWTLDVAEAAADADVVVLCTPVGLIVEKAAEAMGAMRRGSILSDVASTKAAVTRRIEAMLPDGIAFVPGHPIAGSEQRGIESARADLFEDAWCILTPTRRTPEAAVRRIRRMWERMGAKVETMGAEKHDRVVAEISHLPHIVAPALMNAVAAGKLPYAAAGLRDTTRIAASDVGLWVDIFRDNRRNVLRALGRFRRELDAIEGALDGADWAALSRMLERARRRRRSLDTGAGWGGHTADSEHGG